MDGPQLDPGRRVIGVRQVEIALLTGHGPAAMIAALAHDLAGGIEHNGIERERGDYDGSLAPPGLVQRRHSDNRLVVEGRGRA